MEVVFLDTNAYTSYRMGDESVLHWLGKSEAIHLSLFVLGELLTGFRAGNRESTNRRELEQFLTKPGVRVTMPTRRTAEYFSMVKTRLRAKGTPIPINDIWVAAHCLEHGALLISKDVHFEQVEGLRRS